MKMGLQSGFWSGGRGEYLKALRQEAKEKIEPLRQSLRSETDPHRKGQLKELITAIRTEFKNKKKAADSSLFTKA
jgi:vacuolar-type H+-ATPase subunit E/Vma4